MIDCIIIRTGPVWSIIEANGERVPCSKQSALMRLATCLKNGMVATYDHMDLTTAADTSPRAYGKISIDDPLARAYKKRMEAQS